MTEPTLHINAKFHIYNQLLRAQKLYISEPCRAYCGTERLKVWLQGWDKVEVEYAVSSFRPGVALLSNNRVMRAIEVSCYPFSSRAESALSKRGCD
jgi:hypothetical protein